MTDQQFKEQLIHELQRSRGSLIKRLRDGTYPDLAEFIKRKTSFIEQQKPNDVDKYSWLYRIYCVIHDINDFPLCHNPNCENKIDKPSGFLGEKKGFRSYCCVQCGAAAPDVIKHRQENCMANYGVTNKSKLEEVKNKLRESRLKNNNAKIAAEKSRKTRFEKNNGLWHDKDFGNKVKISKIKNGHSAGWNNLEKRKNTLIDKYRVDNTFCLPQVRKASFNALMKKSYEEHILKCKFDEPLFTFDEYLNRINDGQIFKFKCRKCGTIFESSHHDGYHKKCPICYPKLDGISLEEIEFGNMIKSFLLNEEIIIGSRNIIAPLELDIYIPEKKLAIEFDGLFWHSDANSNITKNYHLNKTELCEKQGIQLIHVFEDEWIEKRNIVKSRIKNLLGIYDKTIFARKCEIKEVDPKESKQFQDENHIQGNVNAKIHLGLYFNDKLIALMTFGKCRFDKKHEWEMLRFCNKLDHHIPGSASKLLKYFEKTYIT